MKFIQKQGKVTEAARSNTEKGLIVLEFAVVFPVVLSIFLAFIGLDSHIQTQRAIEWAVEEAMLCNRLEKDIPEISSEVKKFSFEVTAEKEPQSTCESSTSGALTRCQAAYQNMILVHRAISSFLGVGRVNSLTVTSEFQDIIVEGSSSSRLSNNRILTLRVVGNSSKQLLQGWLPTNTIERTEVIG